MPVPASLLVSSALCVGASACASTGLAFHATFAASVVLMLRALAPELVDGFFGRLDARARRDSCLVRSAVGSLRDAARASPAIAPVYARAEERFRRAHASVAGAIDGLDRSARAKLGGVADAADAAFLCLRLAAGVINLSATLLIPLALQEAKSRAPSVLRWTGVKEIRVRAPPSTPGSCSKPDTTMLVVWCSAIFMYCAQLLVLNTICSGITTFAACFSCFAALCGFALLEADRIYALDTRGSSTANAAGGATEMEMGHTRDAWKSLWIQIIVTHFSDACSLGFVLGKRPLALAFLAIFNLAALKVARQIYQTPDDGEEANGGAPGNVNKCDRAAVTVVAIDVAKVVATYVVIDFHMGALCFATLCFKVALMLFNTGSLSDAGASGSGGDDIPVEGVGLAGDAGASGSGGDDIAVEGAGLAGDAEASEDVSTEDSSSVAASDHEEESLPAEEHPDVSDSEEQRCEESDHSSTSSMDDWSLVGPDPMMPVNVNGGTSRRFRFLP